MASNGRRKGKGASSRPREANGSAKQAAAAALTKASEAAAAKEEDRVEKAEAYEALRENVRDADEPQPEPVTPPVDEAPPKGATWGEPIARFERAWARFETRLIVWVLAAQVLALVAWVFLKGLSQPITPEDSSGRIFRSALLAIVGGSAAWRATKRLDLSKRRAVTMSAIAIGVAVGWYLAVGSTYFDNVKGWLQEGSLLTLCGGLRGIATSLTLWLALLGGSLATASGKHIHIDVVFRFLPKKRRVPAAVVNYLAAAAVCISGAWGFVDHTSITMGSDRDDSAGAKVAKISSEIGEELFFARKQIGLDLRSLPHVVAGTRYDTWMTGAAWNAWIRDAGFDDHFSAKDVKNIVVPEDTPTHSPFVVSPDGKITRGMLVRTLWLVFPFGLFAIGVRFLLRVLMLLSGHLSPDPDEQHKEDLRAASTETGEGGA